MKPFSQSPFNASPGSDPSVRLRSALVAAGAQHLNDRLSIPFDRPWAKECIARFDPRYPDLLVVQIFPGNTKGQGSGLYQLNRDWINRNSVVVDGMTYNVAIGNHTKFMHIQGNYITSVDFPMSDASQRLHQPIHTLENQENIAGRWHRHQWPQLDEILSDYFNFDWQAECEFAQHFTNSGRNQLDLALGYSVTMAVPYQVLQQMDVNPADNVLVGQFILRCMNQLLNLIEN